MAPCSPHRCEQVHSEPLRYHKTAVENVEQWSALIWACTWLQGCTDLHVLSRGTIVRPHSGTVGPWLLLAYDFSASRGWSVSAVPGWWRHWWYWLPPRSDSSQGPLGHHVSSYPLLPPRSSDCPSVDWCPNPGQAGDPSRDLIILSRTCLGGAGGAYRHREARNIKMHIMCCFEELRRCWINQSFHFSTLGKFLNPVLNESMICIPAKYPWIGLFSLYIQQSLWLS